MRYILLSFLLIACGTRENSQLTQQSGGSDSIPVSTPTEPDVATNMLGVWTDGSGPNASFAIERDSIYNVEHFTYTRYEYSGDSIKFFYDDMTYTSKVSMPHIDTMIFINESGSRKYWRFRD